MTLLVDATVVLRWFVKQPGHEEAAKWLDRLVDYPTALVAPDLIRFEVAGALARLQTKRDGNWAERCFERFDRLGLRQIPTDRPLFMRAIRLARELKVGGYDAIYLAHAEALETRWLTADSRALRRLKGDPRVEAL